MARSMLPRCATSGRGRQAMVPPRVGIATAAHLIDRARIGIGIGIGIGTGTGIGIGTGREIEKGSD